MTITETFDTRSTSVPAKGANSSTGRISASTTAVTPRAEPVSSRTSKDMATVANTSPHWLAVRAPQSRR